MITATEVEKVRIEKFSISTSLLIRAALKKGLNCAFLPERVIKISNKTSTFFFRDTSLPCNDVVAAKMACNKSFLRRLLKKEGLPAPRTITLRNPAAWINILESSLKYPLVVKPIHASHANGATLNIKTAKELEQAVQRAFTYNKKNKTENRVLVEEYFAGHDLRLLVVGERVVSVVKRDPAYVIGDGHSTVRQLVHTFNDQWKSPRKYELPLCPIPLDIEVSRYLSRNNLTLNSIIPEGQKTYLRWNANVSTGGRAYDITDTVHANIEDLAVHVAKLSHLDVSGVDILCKDFKSGDVSSDNVSILEINESPGFDIHYFPVEGSGRDVCSDILNHIFQAPGEKKNVPTDHIETLLKNMQFEYASTTHQTKRTILGEK